jgi:transposase-like protein
MSSCRPALFRKQQFEPAVIVTCVRWYLRFSLSLRDVEELMAERNLAVDHTTVWCWVQAGDSEAITGQLKSSALHGSWINLRARSRPLDVPVPCSRQSRRDANFYLSETRDREAAKRFLQTALANPDKPQLSSSHSRIAQRR